MRWQPPAGTLPRFAASLSENLRAFALLARVGAAKGALSGALFALLLGWRERRRVAEELSAARVVRWGVLAGALWMATPLVVARTRPTWRDLRPALAAVTLTQGLLAALLAAVTLWLVRRDAAREARAPQEPRPAPRALGAAAPSPVARGQGDARAPVA